MFKKILVPVDSTEKPPTQLAVEEAIDFAKRYAESEEFEFLIIHVYTVDSKMTVEEKREEIKEIFDMVKDVGITNYKALYREGDPSKQIVKTAVENRVDMIVMGSGKLHDRSTKGKIEKFLYGSVTEKVIHEAPCPVWIARP